MQRAGADNLSAVVWSLTLLAFPWAGGGAPVEAVWAGSTALCLPILIQASAGNLPGRLPRTSLVACGVLFLLGLYHLVSPTAEIHDAFYIDQWRHLKTELPGVIVTTDGFARVVWMVLLALSLPLMSDVFARSGKAKSWVLFSLAVGGAGVGLAGFVSLHANAPSTLGFFPAESTDRLFGPFMHDHPAAALMSLSAGAAIALLAGSGFSMANRKTVIAGLVCMLAIGFGIARQQATAGHSLFVLILLGWAALGFLRGRIRIAMLLSVASVWGGLFVATLVEGLNRPPPQPNAVLASNRGDRLVISEDARRPQFLGDQRVTWQAATAMVRERPFVGWGPAGWARHNDRFCSDAFVRSFFPLMQFCHQDFLQIMVEWGIVGAGALLALCLPSLRGLIAGLGSDQAGDRALSLGLLLGMIAVATHALIQFPLQFPAVQWAFVVALALACGPSPLPSRERPPAGRHQ